MSAGSQRNYGTLILHRCRKRGGPVTSLRPRTGATILRVNSCCSPSACTVRAAATFLVAAISRKQNALAASAVRPASRGDARLFASTAGANLPHKRRRTSSRIAGQGRRASARLLFRAAGPSCGERGPGARGWPGAGRQRARAQESVRRPFAGSARLTIALCCWPNQSSDLKSPNCGLCALCPEPKAQSPKPKAQREGGGGRGCKRMRVVCV